MSERKAGSQLISFFLNDPLGEELLEGTAGGLIAGASQLGSDQTLGQTALETAAAIAGGIGLGMAGRRLGAMAGKQLHKGPLKQQDLRRIGRAVCSNAAERESRTDSGSCSRGLACDAA